MGCEYAWTGRIVVKTFSGFVTGEEFIETAETVASHPRFDDLLVIYNDLSDVVGHSIDAKTYERVAACRLGASLTNRNFRVVFVVQHRHALSLHRAVEPNTLGRPFDPVICESMDAAREWFTRQTVADGIFNRAY